MDPATSLSGGHIQLFILCFITLIPERINLAASKIRNGYQLHQATPSVLIIILESNRADID